MFLLFIISVLILVYKIISFKAYIERMWCASHFSAVTHLACVPSLLSDEEKHINSFRKKFHLASSFLFLENCHGLMALLQNTFMCKLLCLLDFVRGMRELQRSQFPTPVPLVLNRESFKCLMTPGLHLHRH